MERNQKVKPVQEEHSEPLSILQIYRVNGVWQCSRVEQNYGASVVQGGAAECQAVNADRELVEVHGSFQT